MHCGVHFCTEEVGYHRLQLHGNVHHKEVVLPFIYIPTFVLDRDTRGVGGLGLSYSGSIGHKTEGSLGQ